MATDLNTVGLVGRLVKNCELRYSQNGNAICNFSLAVNRRTKDSQGNWSDKVSFFECSYFGKAAEGVSQYLTKGQQVSIQGYLDQQTWESNGQKRSKVVIIVNSLGLLGNSKPNAQQNSHPNATYSQSGNNYQPQQNGQPQGQYDAGPESFQDDIQF